MIFRLLICAKLSLLLFTHAFAQNTEYATKGLNINGIGESVQTRSFVTLADDLLNKEMSYGHFSGVVMMQHHGETIFSSVSRGLPSGQNTRFDIGSISKQFTAAAILELANSGHLQLFDPINKYLGRFTEKKWRKITIHQLLTHTSGIPSIYQTEQGLEIFFPKEEETTIDFLIEKFRYDKLLFSPGSEFSYSNSGYVLLAAIIESISGKSFQSFMEENIFKQYKLAQTSFKRDANCAKPYYGYRTGLLSEAPVYHSSWMIGCGGVYSNASDLLKWTQLIQTKDYLNFNLQKEYLKSHTSKGYGYGWQFDIEERIQHDGATAGFVSSLSFHPKTGVSIAILSNRSFEQIHDFKKSAKYIAELEDKLWKLLEGYKIESLPEISKSSTGARLFSLDDQWVKIVPKNDSVFLVSHSSTTISRLIANTRITSNDKLSIALKNLAEVLENERYFKLARSCTSDMKFVCYSGLMRYGMKVMKKKTGDVQTIIPYKVGENYGLLRMKGELGNLDLIAYFDSEENIQGIFENGFYQRDKIQPQIAYAINESTFYIDGLPDGENPCWIEIEDGIASVKQLNRALVFIEVID